jgi:hypothetical protein
MIILNNNTVRLCRQGTCCPLVERVSPDEFTITDDFNGKVKMTRDEMSMLKESIEHFEKQSS